MSGLWCCRRRLSCDGYRSFCRWLQRSRKTGPFVSHPFVYSLVLVKRCALCFVPRGCCGFLEDRRTAWAYWPLHTHLDSCYPSCARLHCPRPTMVASYKVRSRWFVRTPYVVPISWLQLLKSHGSACPHCTRPATCSTWSSTGCANRVGYPGQLTAKRGYTRDVYPVRFAILCPFVPHLRRWAA